MELDFLKIQHNNVPPKQGKVLISEPFSQDSYFKRSVVFLTEHNENGSIGFILNKSIEIRITDLLKEFPDIHSKVALGGPVQTNTIHYIHTFGKSIPNSMEVGRGIYWGGNIDQVKVLAETGLLAAEKIRFFIGYSGWSPGQLEKELTDNYWIVSELSKDDIFNAPVNTIWEDTLNRMEKRYKLWTTFPENPELN